MRVALRPASCHYKNAEGPWRGRYRSQSTIWRRSHCQSCRRINNNSRLMCRRFAPLYSPKEEAAPTRQITASSYYASFMGYGALERVDHKYLPSQLPGVIHGCSGAASRYSSFAGQGQSAHSRGLRPGPCLIGSLSRPVLPMPEFMRPTPFSAVRSLGQLRCISTGNFWAGGQ